MRDRPIGVATLATGTAAAALYCQLAGVALLLSGSIFGTAGSVQTVATLAVGAIFFALSLAAFLLGYAFWVGKSWSLVRGHDRLRRTPRRKCAAGHPLHQARVGPGSLDRRPRGHLVPAPSRHPRRARWRGPSDRGSRPRVREARRRPACALGSDHLARRLRPSPSPQLPTVASPPRPF